METTRKIDFLFLFFDTILKHTYLFFLNFARWRDVQYHDRGVVPWGKNIFQQLYSTSIESGELFSTTYEVQSSIIQPYGLHCTITYLSLMTYLFLVLGKWLGCIMYVVMVQITAPRTLYSSETQQLEWMKNESIFSELWKCQNKTKRWNNYGPSQTQS